MDDDTESEKTGKHESKKEREGEIENSIK